MRTLTGADDIRYQHWEVPGKPLALSVSRAVTRAILSQNRRGGRAPEVGGILLGTVEGEDALTVRIEDCVALPCEHLFGPAYSLSETDKQSYRRTLAQYKRGRGGFHPVGFYRTHMRRGLSLDSDDLLLFSELFSSPSDVALLVKPRRLRPSRAAFFLCEEAQFRPEASCLEFNILEQSEQNHSGVAAAGSQERGAEEEAQPAPRRGSPLWCSWWVQAPLLACLLGAWGLLGFFSGKEFDTIVQRTKTPPRDPYALSLMVVQYENNLFLTWDRKAPVITAAERGSLTINDGAETRTLGLSRDELREGSVTYHKSSSHVRFRLEVFLKGGRGVSESWESATPAPVVTPPPAAKPR
jgi:hypothetical protein